MKLFGKAIRLAASSKLSEMTSSHRDFIVAIVATPFHDKLAGVRLISAIVGELPVWQFQLEQKVSHPHTHDRPPARVHTLLSPSRMERGQCPIRRFEGLVLGPGGQH